MPTRWSSWTAAVWPKAAPTANCWGAAACTRACMRCNSGPHDTTPGGSRAGPAPGHRGPVALAADGRRGFRHARLLPAVLVVRRIAFDGRPVAAGAGATALDPRGPSLERAGAGGRRAAA